MIILILSITIIGAGAAQTAEVPGRPLPPTFYQLMVLALFVFLFVSSSSSSGGGGGGDDGSTTTIMIIIIIIIKDYIIIV